MDRQQGTCQQALPLEFSLLFALDCPAGHPKISIHLKKMPNMSEDAASPWTCETLLKPTAFPSGEEGLQGLFKKLLVHLSAEIQKTNIFKVVIESCFWDFDQISELSYYCFRAHTVQEWCMNNESKEKSSLLSLDTWNLWNMMPPCPPCPLSWHTACLILKVERAPTFHAGAIKHIQVFVC